MKTTLALVLTCCALCSNALAEAVSQIMPSECSIIVSLFTTTKYDHGSGEARTWDVSVEVKTNGAWLCWFDVPAVKEGVTYHGSMGQKKTPISIGDAREFYQAVAATLNNFKMPQPMKDQANEMLIVAIKVGNQQGLTAQIAITDRASVSKEVAALLALSKRYMPKTEDAK